MQGVASPGPSIVQLQPVSPQPWVCGHLPGIPSLTNLDNCFGEVLWDWLEQASSHGVLFHSAAIFTVLVGFIHVCVYIYIGLGSKWFYFHVKSSIYFGFPLLPPLLPWFWFIERKIKGQHYLYFVILSCIPMTVFSVESCFLKIFQDGPEDRHLWILCDALFNL